MSKTLRPVADADFSRVRAVFTDVDGTLTTDGRLTSATLGALERLHASGVPVVLVSGRPSGWGECWARQWPVAGVIVENGGLHYAWRGSKLVKTYAERPAQRARHRSALRAHVAAAVRAVRGRGCRSTRRPPRSTSPSTIMKMRGLGPAGRQARGGAGWAGRDRCALVGACQLLAGSVRQADCGAPVSSVEWGTSLRPRDPRYVYVGDSFNDAPMFGAFALSVGVANVLDVVDRLDARPAFITRAREARFRRGRRTARPRAEEKIMSRLVKVPVTAGLGRHIRAGHPWVFKKALEEIPRIPAGSVVDVVDGGKFAGRGYFDPFSAIAVRILTLEPGELIDQAFFERRVRQAYESRLQLISTA